MTLLDTRPTTTPDFAMTTLPPAHSPLELLNLAAAQRARLQSIAPVLLDIGGAGAELDGHLIELARAMAAIAVAAANVAGAAVSYDPQADVLAALLDVVSPDVTVLTVAAGIDRLDPDRLSALTKESNTR